MQFTLFEQINLIAVGVCGLTFCVLGYKFARFLLPICGMIVIESILYVTVGGYVESTNLSGALFYGGTAVASYIILFFALRLSGFFTGLLGAGLFFYFVVTAFGLFNIPAALPAAAALTLTAGLISFVYNRVGVIIASALFGAAVAGGTGAFLVLAPGAGYAKGQSIAGGFNSIAANNTYIFLAVVLTLLIAGVLVQLKLTGKSQMLGSRISIKLESKSANG